MSSLLKKYIEQIYGGEIKNILYCPDGQIKTDVSFDNTVHIYSGSFNPLHFGHKEIYASMPENNSYFEYSLNRWGKDQHPAEHVEDIVRQFTWYAPLLITNGITFLDKIYYLQAKSPVFHIGFDTFERVVKAYGYAGSGIVPANFVVYDRIIEGTRYSIKNYSNLPHNFSLGISCPAEISSTKLRGKND